MEVDVMTDGVKPAYIFDEVDFRNTVRNPAVKATPAVAPPAAPSPPPATRTMRSGRPYLYIPLVNVGIFLKSHTI
jgi:hypothetical protein